MPNVKMHLFNYGEAINDISKVNEIYSNSSVLSFFQSSWNDTIWDKNVEEMTTAAENETYFDNDYIPLMSKTLGSDGFPLVEKYVNPHSEDGKVEKGSLKYLFDPDMGKDKNGFVQGAGRQDKYDTSADVVSYQSQHFTVNNPTSLFKMNPKTGVYYYDSLLNAAYFQRDKDSSGKELTSGNFKLYDYTERRYGNGNNDYSTGKETTTGLDTKTGHFFPFNIGHISGNVDYGTGVRPTISTENPYVTTGAKVPVDYKFEQSTKVDTWFGMSLECEFQQTSDGTFNGQDMIFQFMGDDDVWVYIDDVLVLDIGGAHRPRSASVNFKTGVVSYPKRGNDGLVVKDDNKNVVQENTDLKTLFDNASADMNDFDNSGTSTTFKSNTKHNLKFFILERGGADSYFQLMFNLPKGSAGVSKKVEGLDSELKDPRTYTFQLQDGSGNAFTSQKDSTLTQLNYIYEKADGTSEEKVMPIGGSSECKFNLKDGESVIFNDIPDGDQYKIVELDSPTGTNVSSTVKEGSAEERDYNNGDVLTADSGNFAQITYSNAVPTNSLTLVTKVLDPDDYEVDEMPNSTYYIGLHLFDNDGNDYGTKLIPVSGATELNKDKLLSGLPSGATYELWEYIPDDTNNRYEAPKLSDANGTLNYTARFVETGSTPALNDFISGIVSGQTLTVVNKLLASNSISVTFKYYDRKINNGEPANIDSKETSYSKLVDLTDTAYSGYVDDEYKINDIDIFGKMITEVGAYASTNGAIDNVVDSYELFTSQNSAKNAVTGYTYTTGISDHYATHNITAEEAVYHTNSKRQPLTNPTEQDKWVTYYQSGTLVDPENDSNVDLNKITGITVWLYNKPKTYTVTTHVSDENGNKKEIEYSAYYNQQLGVYGYLNNNEVVSNDEQECFDYCERYSIPLEEYDARGKNKLHYDTDKTLYENAGALESTSDGKFSYWTDSEENGNILSVDQSYLYRITRNMDLYANYGKGDAGKGVASTNEGIDVYYDTNGTKKLRLNTMMNPYGFAFGKISGNTVCGNTNIKYAAVAYMSLNDPNTLPTEDMINGENGIKATIKTKAASIVENLGTNTKGSGSFGVYNGETQIGTVKVIVYSTNEGKLLTNKNRLQFAASYTSPTGNNVKKVLAFTSLYYNDGKENSTDNGWYVSDNYVTHTMTSTIGVSQE